MTNSNLTDEFIAELLAGSRTKGQYKTFLDEFVASDEPVVNVKETWPVLKDKKASAMYQSFNNAKAKLNGAGEAIRVINRNDELFLMHTGRVELRLNPDSAEI